MARPAWRQMYDAWEQAVAPGLQEMTGSAGFRDVMAASARVNAELAKEVERMSRQWLHLWNLPTATDVRGLRRQVSSLERELAAVRRELAAAPTTPADQPPPAQSPSLGLIADEVGDQQSYGQAV